MPRVLVVNSGSTSLKLSTVDEQDTSEQIASLDAVPDDVAAVAHRVVHGGGRFRDPVLLDGDVMAELERLVELAPLHNAAALRGIQEARAAAPDVPHVAVFDTAFHATIPPEAATYAVPARWRDEWGIRRYGFHGLSVQWAAERVQVGRLVVCHLGGGCSVTAVRDGRSVDTTMGFSPLEGVAMATRSGSIDPEIVLHLLRAGLASAEEIEDALEHESGLLGLSGVSTRVDEITAAGGSDARLALDVFGHRIAGAVAACAVAAGGLDALVFTGGIGEGSPSTRADVCGRLAFLGVELDERANETAEPDAVISAETSRVAVHAVQTREDVVAARAARDVLGL